VNSNIIAVVDAITDKVGMSVEAAAPLAQETVRQYVTKQTLFAVVGFVVVLVLLAIAAVMFCLARKVSRSEQYDSDEREFGCYVISIVIVVIAIATAIVSVYHLGNAIAPYPSLLGL
jgi:uncharacterized membrane protein YbhN (UPF0104 family)